VPPRLIAAAAPPLGVIRRGRRGRPHQGAGANGDGAPGGRQPRGARAAGGARWLPFVLGASY
jgi:hypothetical protein